MAWSKPSPPSPATQWSFGGGHSDIKIDPHESSAKRSHGTTPVEENNISLAGHQESRVKNLRELRQHETSHNETHPPITGSTCKMGKCLQYRWSAGVGARMGQHCSTNLSEARNKRGGGAAVPGRVGLLGGFKGPPGNSCHNMTLRKLS